MIFGTSTLSSISSVRGRLFLEDSRLEVTWLGRFTLLVLCILERVSKKGFEKGSARVEIDFVWPLSLNPIDPRRRNTYTKDIWKRLTKKSNRKCVGQNSTTKSEQKKSVFQFCYVKEEPQFFWRFLELRKFYENRVCIVWTRIYIRLELLRVFFSPKTSFNFFYEKNMFFRQFRFSTLSFRDFISINRNSKRWKISTTNLIFKFCRIRVFQVTRVLSK